MSLSMNNELILNLETCHSFLKKFEDKMNSLHKEDNYLDICHELVQKYQNDLSINGRIKFFLKVLVTALFPMFFVSAAILSGILVQMGIQTLPSYGTPFACIIDLFLSVIITVLIQIIRDTRTKRSLASYIKETEDSEKSIQKKHAEIQNLLATPESTLTQSIIPPDYRKAYIVEKFIYFFRNGHVDTMKEAVHEYDNYRHNKKIQTAAEQSAAAAAETARNSARMAKTAEEIEFWTIYNAFVNSK